jgi:TonB family protein
MLKAPFVASCLIPCALALPSFSGTVQDGRGPIDGAKIKLWDAAMKRSLETSSASGRFSLNSVNEGEYLFTVECDGHMPVYGAVRLIGEGPHDIKVVMLTATQDTGLTGAGSALRGSRRPAPTSPTPRSVKPAQVIRKVAPVYPRADKRARVAGTVTIATLILSDGTLDDLVVLSAPDRSLAEAALLAVRQWRYSPTQLDGRAVEANLTIDVNFGL